MAKGKRVRNDEILRELLTGGKGKTVKPESQKMNQVARTGAKKPAGKKK